MGISKWDASGLSLPSLDINDGLGDTVESAEQVADREQQVQRSDNNGA